MTHDPKSAVRPAALDETESSFISKASTGWLFTGVLALSGLLSGTTTTAPIAESQVRHTGGWTSTARTMSTRTDPRPARPAAAVTVADTAQPPKNIAGVEPPGKGADVRWLHDASGLTWEQLGRMFGVSRRAVHMWANGGRMNATNAEAMARLISLVRSLPGGTDERRAALLAPTADGTSIVDQFRMRHRLSSGDLSGSAFQPEELLGALHDHPAQS